MKLNFDKRIFKQIGIICFLACMILLNSCRKDKTAIEILSSTIKSIDGIESVYYKQDMVRSNPRKQADTIFRYREMYFKRLISDSIVGVKGHWYMYINDKKDVIYEDIYDGNKLIRKNNRDSLARIYDLIKYPDFRRKHFWSHNTLYGMQCEFKYMLENAEFYHIKRLNDTLIDNKNCYQILVRLENMTSMPGFAISLQQSQGSVSETFYCIDKASYYPIKMKALFYSVDHPENKVFIDQKYYDVKLNLKIAEKEFDTSDKILAGFKTREIKPD